MIGGPGPPDCLPGGQFKTPRIIHLPIKNNPRHRTHPISPHKATECPKTSQETEACPVKRNNPANTKALMSGDSYKLLASESIPRTVVGGSWFIEQLMMILGLTRKTIVSGVDSVIKDFPTRLFQLSQYFAVDSNHTM